MNPQHVVAAGTTCTGGTFALFMTAAEPVMRLITFGLTAAVAVATLVYTIKKIREKRKD